MCQRNLLPRMLETVDLSLSLPFYQRYLKKSWLGSWVIFGNQQYASYFSVTYWRGLGTCDALLTLSLHLHVAFDRGMDGRLVQLNFSAEFDHCSLLYKQTSIGIGRQFLSIVSEFLSDRRQRVGLDGKVSALLSVVSSMPQRSVLAPLLFVLHTSQLFHIIGNYIVGYADDIKIYAASTRPFSCL